MQISWARYAKVLFKDSLVIILVVVWIIAIFVLALNSKWSERVTIQTSGIIIGVATTIFIGIPVYLFKQLMTIRNQKSGLENIVRNILAELLINKDLAEGPFKGVIAFESDAFDKGRGQITRLPQKLQNALFDYYREIKIANSIVEKDRQLPYGRGYQDQNYMNACKMIAQRISDAIEQIQKWLNDES